ncbi:MAG: Putative filament-capping protein FliD [Thermoanaerobacterales bacterium 50_218]|nr:MAG: Putative filament-capping protein FliD [Thermoanaerobacterales bacterium 50_218]HAA89167.1 flagellar cap protein [Peptococcaceae bacterium]
MASVNRVFGLASGLDIDKIVSDLMKAHRLQVDKLRQDKQIWQWRQEDYRTINSALLSLRNTVFNLKLQGSFLTKKAISSNTSIVTATATSTSTAGTYQVKVNSLATVAMNASTEAIASTDFDPNATLVSQQDKFSGVDWNTIWDPETHEFSFTINGQNFTFDGDTATLNSIIAAVNANKAAGVTMFYDSSSRKVVITTTKTGDNNPGGPEITFSGSFLTNVLKLDSTKEQGGTDASFEINGFAVTSHTNTYTINGTTFNFVGADPNQIVTVTVEQDIDAVVNVIKNFVDKYNETIELINKEYYEERYPDYRPLTDTQIEEGKLTDKQIDAWQEKARSGLLKGDAILNWVLTSLRRVVSGIVEGFTESVTVTTSSGQQVSVVADRLSVIGITTGSYTEHGKLYLDENRLREALQSNPEAVMQLFTRTRDENGNEITETSKKGIAVQLYDALNSAISRITSQAGSAGAFYDQSYIGRLIRDIDQRISAMEEWLANLEDRYYRQFTALEQAIARMNVQSMWLAQQFMGTNE